MAMDVGLLFANSGRSSDGRHAQTLAIAAEAVGLESLWAVQHVVMPVSAETKYPYTSSGNIPGGPFAPAPDPLVWLGYAAAVTTRIRLGTGVLILPQQHPLVIAKQAATLDRLSGGRLILGVGAGWLREEFDAVGAAFEGRGKRMDESIDAMRRAWTDRVAVSPGPAFPHAGIAMEPKPYSGTVPIIIGGNSPAAAKRAGRRGDGYFPMSVQGDELRRLVGTVRESAERAERDPSSIAITVRAPRNRDEAELILELGIERVVVGAPDCDPTDLRDRLAGTLAAVRELLP